MPLFQPTSGTPGGDAEAIAAAAVAGHEAGFNHGHFGEAYDHSKSPHLQFEGLNKLIVSDHVPDDLQEGDVVLNIGNQ